MAALFGDEDGPPPADAPAPKSQSSKKRDPSFSGVANLFGVSYRIVVSLFVFSNFIGVAFECFPV